MQKVLLRMMLMGKKGNERGRRWNPERSVSDLKKQNSFKMINKKKKKKDEAEEDIEEEEDDGKRISSGCCWKCFLSHSACVSPSGSPPPKTRNRKECDLWLFFGLLFLFSSLSFFSFFFALYKISLFFQYIYTPLSPIPFCPFIRGMDDIVRKIINGYPTRSSPSPRKFCIYLFLFFLSFFSYFSRKSEGWKG